MQQQLELLEEVKQAFEQWRNTRPKQERIPEYLWEQVNELRGHYSDHMLSRTLGISHKQIRNHISSTDTITFVETVSSGKQSTQCCDIELKRSCGAVLRITSLPINVVTDLIPSFLGQ